MWGGVATPSLVLKINQSKTVSTLLLYRGLVPGCMCVINECNWSLEEYNLYNYINSDGALVCLARLTVWHPQVYFFGHRLPNRLRVHKLLPSTPGLTQLVPHQTISPYQIKKQRSERGNRTLFLVPSN